MSDEPGFTVAVKHKGEATTLVGFNTDRKVIEGYAKDLREGWKKAETADKPSMIQVRAILRRDWERAKGAEGMPAFR